MKILFSMLVFSIGISASAKKKSNVTRKAPAKKLQINTLSKFKVSRIDVSGNKKIEKDAILAKIKIKPDSEVTEEQVREDLLSIFQLGYFKNIDFEKDNEVLTIKVTEKPSISEIIFDGNSDVKTDDLKDPSTIKAYEILNLAKLKEGVDKLQKFYEDKGFYLVRIDPVLEPSADGQNVKITFKIKEGEKVKVKKIFFIGNSKFSDNYLKDKMMFLKEEGYFSGLSGSGTYKQDSLEKDVQLLRMAYLFQGYIQAKVERPLVTVTPDKRGIYMTIRVEEGEQFDVGEVDFSGDLLFTKDELFESIKIHKNKIFAFDVLQKDLSELQAKYGDLGYAYANINPHWEILEKERRVNLNFEVDKGNKVYFGRINVTGNTRTRDKVVRRELKVRESELYNETRRRQSQENIQRLGFFEEVNFKTSTPPDQLDVMNVDIVVKERNTGQIQVNAGYGTSTGFTFGGSVQQTNFLGKGQSLGVSVQLSANTSLYDLSFTEPYFNDTLWSVGYRLFQSSNSARLDFNETKTGASVSLGHPIAENTRGYLTGGYTATRLSEVYTSDAAGNRVLLTDYDLFPLNTASGDSASLGASIEYDTRNDRFKPTKGVFGRLSYTNVGLIGGNLKYYRAGTDFRFFKNVFWDVVWRNSMSYGIIGSNDSSQPPPFNELFLLGGPYSLRGFRYGHVGKMKFSNTIYRNLTTAPNSTSPQSATDQAMRFVGGLQQAIYQTELQFPFIREADIYTVVFFDIGQADDTLTSTALYSDYGFGLRWFSPIGPLRFEWGFPLNRNPLYHENGVFEFSIGTPF